MIGSLAARIDVPMAFQSAVIPGIVVMGGLMAPWWAPGEGASVR